MNRTCARAARKTHRLPMAVPLLALSAAVLTACGGSSTDLAQDQPPAALAPVACTMDSTVPGSYEEGRLVNKLQSTDTLSFAQRILQSSGFDRFGPEFAQQLCREGLDIQPS